MTALRPVLALVAAATLVAAAHAKNPEQIKDQVKGSVAFIQGKSGHGTGFVTRHGLVVTNAHVVGLENPADLVAKFIDDTGKTSSSKVDLLHFDKGRDLAVLRLTDPPKGLKPLDVNAKFEVSKKADVLVIGNPGQRVKGLTVINSLGEASVSNEVVVMHDQPFFDLTLKAKAEKPRAELTLEEAAELFVASRTKVGPGNSGGPVLDSDGRVIGVLSRGVINSKTGIPGGSFYCIPAGDVIAALDAVGTADTWEAARKQATARHAFDHVMAHYYADLLVAETVMQVRRTLKKEDVELSFAWTYRGRAGVVADVELREAVAAGYEKLFAAAKWSRIAALQSTELTDSQKQQVRNLTLRLDEACKIVKKKEVKSAELKLCVATIKEGRDLLGKYKENLTGWSEDDVTQLWVRTLAAEGISLTVKK